LVDRATPSSFGLFAMRPVSLLHERVGALAAEQGRTPLATPIFDRADPPDVTVVLDEAVLHRPIGTPAVMHDALVHVAEMALRPSIVVQVVPSSKGANAGIGGAFDIASADGTSDTLRMDGVEDQTPENRSLVRKHRVAFNRVRGDALSRDASRDLILKAAEQWKTT
jgi:Domain of unknown function (DUF5753)